MIDPNLNDFFQAKWKKDLEKNQKKVDVLRKKATEEGLSEKEASQLEQVVEQGREWDSLEGWLKFWLPDAAKKAASIRATTHPAKFSHPAADVRSQTPLVFHPYDGTEGEQTGYLCDGTFTAEQTVDFVANAAIIPVVEFLKAPLQNEKTVLQNIYEGTPEADEILQLGSSEEHSVEELRDGFLEALGKSDKDTTDTRVKQVYFPTGEGKYHLLSVLTNSVGISELKRRVTERRPKWDKKKLVEPGYFIPNIGHVKYGGTKPQNISYLNSKSIGLGGTLLLPSLPPAEPKVRRFIPRKNFFYEALKFSYWDFRDVYEHYARLENTDYSNRNINDEIKYLIDKYVSMMLDLADDVRLNISNGNEKAISGLPKSQRDWLNPALLESMPSSPDWLPEIEREMARWFQQGAALLKVKQFPAPDDIIFRDVFKQIHRQRRIQK